MRISRRLMLLLACSALLLAPLLTVQLATGAGRAHACKCGPPAPPSRPSTRHPQSSPGRWSPSETFSFEAEVRPDFTETFWSVELDVDRVWKGPVASTTFVYVWHGPACGYGNFEIGEDFLVYTHQRSYDEADDDTLFVSFCSRTRLIENAGDDLTALGDGQAPEAGITGARPASEDAGQTPDSATTDAPPTSEDPQRGPALATTGADPHPKLPARSPAPAQPTPQQRPETPPPCPPGRSRFSWPSRQPLS